MKCKIHPKYKGIRTPTSTAKGCTCDIVFRAKQFLFREKQFQGHQASARIRAADVLKNYSDYEMALRLRLDAARYEGIAIGTRWCREDLENR